MSNTHQDVTTILYNRNVFERLLSMIERVQSHPWLILYNHKTFTEKGNKAAGGRARKSIGEIKKLVTSYRQASVSESK